jgi:6-phosphogluconolactonase (cycloisomerase 2 family)
MPQEHRILVGSYTNSVTTLSFTADPSPKLEVVSSIEVGHHPSWLAPLPASAKGEHHAVILTGLEQADGQIIALGVDASGVATKLAQVPSGGRDPASMCVNPEGSELVVGNYSSGNVVAIPLSFTGPYLQSSGTHSVHFEGTGPNASRQESSHPHDVVFHGDELLIPDLGADKTWRLQRGANGKWEVKGHVEYEPGSGPRHVLVHDGALYTALELSSGVAAHRLLPLPAPAELLGTTPTLSAAPSPEALVAEILLPPKSDGLSTDYLYVSNRNDPHAGGDVVSVISIVEGVPELVAEVRTGLKHLRGMKFDSTGRWLVAGGGQGGGVKVFERVDGGKGLKEVAHVDLEGPTSFHWL